MKGVYVYLAGVVLFLGWVAIQIFAPLFGNVDLIDTVYKFDRAVIAMPDGTVVDGKVDKWSDTDGDCVQIKIGDKIYLTHYENVVMISE